MNIILTYSYDLVFEITPIFKSSICDNFANVSNYFQLKFYYDLCKLHIVTVILFALDECPTTRLKLSG